MNIKKVLVIILVVNSLQSLSQSEFNFGFYTIATYNFNILNKKSHLQEFEPITTYPSLLLGHTVKYFFNNKISLLFNISFNKTKCGFIQDLKIADYYSTKIVLQYNLTSFNFTLGTDYVLAKFNKNKALLIANINYGISVKSFNSQEIYYLYNFFNNYSGEAILSYSPLPENKKIFNISLGFGIQNIIKGIGKVEYGCECKSDLNSLDEISISNDVFVIKNDNDIIKKNNYSANQIVYQIYFGFYFKIFYMNIKKNNCKKSNYIRIKYK